MLTFAIVSRIDLLPRLLSDLAGLRQVQRTRTSVGGLMLSGIWVEHRPDVDPGSVSCVREWMSSGPLRIVTPLELSGVWALCRLEHPGISRATLLDAIVDAIRARGRAVDGRFIPVFQRHESLHERHAEWEALAVRQPGIVLPPLEQSASGVITFIEFDPAVGSAAHRAERPRRREATEATPSLAPFRRPAGRRPVHPRKPRSLD